MMRPTIYAVAKRAGVSIATVSRVLNDSPKPTAETRAKVLQAVRELGYQPSAAARCLAGNATETIALIFPQISGPFYSEIIQGAEAQAHQYHYHLLIYGVRDRLGSDSLLRFLSTKVDGMILSTSCASDTYIRGLQRQRIPFVLLGQEKSGIVADSLRPNNQQGAVDVVTHLIEHHHYLRIAFAGRSEEQTHSLARYEGYCQALRDAALPYDADLVVPGAFVESSGYRAMNQLLDLADPPQAVFFANDQMALGALAAAHERQVRIPKDVAIVGFDDINAAAYVQPPLTTVRQDIREQGVLAVQLLLQRVDEPEADPQTLILPTQLVVRRSCGCSVPDAN
jgi:LacI family transcriptional regulator